ncbi:MAG: terpene cyclase/mutase family protein [Gemmataceae bacterium]|nr:terpene cyclase/mutase family protein [Gemmataceae bacterium]
MTCCRNLLLFAAGGMAALLVSVSSGTSVASTGPVLAAAQEDPGIKQTIEYVRRLQTNIGGFTAIAPQPNIRLAPTLRATSAAVRALHYLGGTVPDKAAAAKFVANCWNEGVGGFADFAGGNNVDIFTTAVGLMAVKQLDMPKEKYAAAVKYLADNAKTFEEIRIAAAGLEAIGAKSPVNDAWIAEVRKLQNPDGTFGKGPGQARTTGGAVALLLRLGAPLADKDAVLKALRDGQRLNGGFGKEDEVASDLETTYRVMRAFVMLKAKPANVEGVRSFVAKCRNEDHGYGPAPGEPSNVTATYYAAIIRYWLKD